MSRLKKAIAALGLVGLLSSPYLANKAGAEEPKKQEVSLEEQCRDYKLVEMKPEAKKHYNAGVLQHMKKNYDSAISEYQKAHELDPAARSPPHQIGVCYRKKGDLNKALEWYLKAIEIDPCFHLPYGSLSLIYFELGDYEKSIFYGKLKLETPECVGKEREVVLERIQEAKKILNNI